jgi:polysaccharide biosynthesis transport protein
VDALQLDKLAIDYNSLLRRLENDRLSHRQLLNRLNETVIASQLKSTNVRIIDRAGVPLVPVSPNRTRIYAMGGALFLGVLFGLPILLGIANSKVKSRWDVEEFLGRQLIGEIPKINTIERERLPLIVMEQKEELETEYFNILFSQMRVLSADDRPKAVLVTSNVPEEGKSFIASNLACAFSKHGLRVALVDCDFRRPTQHRYHKLPDDHGIIRWYEEGKGQLDGLKPSEHPLLGMVPLGANLFLLRAGGSAKWPTPMIQSEAFGQLMDGLKTEFDLVIIDSPPGMVFPDALLLAEHCEETIHICRHNTVNRVRVRLLLDRMEKTGTRILGVVFNATSFSGEPHSGYDYKAYQSYKQRA